MCTGSQEETRQAFPTTCIKLLLPVLTLHQSLTIGAVNLKHIWMLACRYSNKKKCWDIRNLPLIWKINCYIMFLTWNQANLTDIKFTGTASQQNWMGTCNINIRLGRRSEKFFSMSHFLRQWGGSCQLDLCYGLRSIKTHQNNTSSKVCFTEKPAPVKVLTAISYSIIACPLCRGISSTPA